MHIYRCELMLLEATFFSSREVSNLYQTEPLLGNIALAYAFGLCQAPYFNDGTIHYKAHLGELNLRGVYVTPGTVLQQPQFIMRQFNAQPDAYWYRFDQNVIVTRSDDTWQVESCAENRPQHGRLRLLAIGNRAVCYVLSREPLALPRYVRLGKFMSKARVEAREVPTTEVEEGAVAVHLVLNPADLPADAQLGAFDLISVPPAPLIRNAVIGGRFHKLPGGDLLPVGMRFNVEQLP